MNDLGRKVFCLILALITLAQSNIAQTTVENSEIHEKIRNEAMSNSQIMRITQQFTDVYGPRLTGSPKLEKAGKWAMKQMDSWGFDKTAMEPWDFGRVGWENYRASGFLVSPVKDSLVFEVMAWTPSTKGLIRGEAVPVIFPRGPKTQSFMDKFFAEYKEKVKGKIVLFGTPAKVPVDFNPRPKRLDEKAIERRLNPQPRPPRTRRTPPARDEPILGFREVAAQLDRFFLENATLVRINDAQLSHGKIQAFQNRSYDPTKTVPRVVMRNEDYGRIWRLLKGGSKVELEFDIQNSIYPEGKTAYNTIGEIAGTDKADEVIMLGGHLDAWHSATGATDNAIGCAVMMEAARILKAIGVKPRRTIRVALWSGEEQGILGSREYIKKHFGTAENPKPAFFKFGGYFNIDSGTGQARFMSIFGPPESAQILRKALLAFKDINFEGVINTNSRRLGGSDHRSFNNAGLPGIGIGVDPIEYYSHSWHTNLDTYERVIEEDAIRSAIIIAAAVYELSMREDMLPRFSKESMPKVP